MSDDEVTCETQRLDTPGRTPEQGAVRARVSGRAGATGTGTVNFNDETPTYTEGGPYPGTDYSGDVPGDDGELTRSLIEEYGSGFPDTNIIAVKSFDDISFSGVSGIEHLAVVDGVNVFAVDEGTIVNNGDGGWQNWGFTGFYDYDPDEKQVTFRR
ncbi:hypothetical protein [Streptomyces niveus]|uniref:hypothetical protein n=1 Tax=Streptomyces niveus TaxID=193462 RepID=UPI0036411675